MEKANHLNLEESTRRLSKKGSRKIINLSRDKNYSNQPKNQLHVSIPENNPT
jgi:hypothetical protein